MYVVEMVVAFKKNLLDIPTNILKDDDDVWKEIILKRGFILLPLHFDGNLTEVRKKTSKMAELYSFDAQAPAGASGRKNPQKTTGKNIPD